MANPGWEEALGRALADQQAVLDEMTLRAEHKRDIIISGDVEALDACLLEEGPLLMRMERAEAERARLLKESGLEGRPLSELLQLAGGAQGEALGERLNSLREAARRLRAANRLNDTLLRSRLQLYELLGQARQAGTYGEGGRRETGAPGAGALDSKA